MDPQAFRDMLLGEMESLYRMAMTLTRRPNDAADLVQETLLKALKAEGQFELRDAGIRPWLFRILHNTFYTKYKRDKRRHLMGDGLAELNGSQVESEQDHPPPAWDLDHMDWEQVDDRLKAAVDALPEHYREPLLLWAVEGLKYREIADVLGVALGTVMSRLHRARKQLTEELAPLVAERRMPGPPGSKPSDRSAERAGGE